MSNPTGDALTPPRITREEAEGAVDSIIEDLSDRRGLRQEWEGIDEDVQNEIREEWIRIVLAAMGVTDPQGPES